MGSPDGSAGVGNDGVGMGVTPASLVLAPPSRGGVDRTGVVDAGTADSGCVAAASESTGTLRTEASVSADDGSDGTAMGSSFLQHDETARQPSAIQKNVLERAEPMWRSLACSPSRLPIIDDEACGETTDAGHDKEAVRTLAAARRQRYQVDRPCTKVSSPRRPVAW